MPGVFGATVIAQVKNFSALPGWPSRRCHQPISAQDLTSQCVGPRQSRAGAQRSVKYRRSFGQRTELRIAAAKPELSSDGRPGIESLEQPEGALEAVACHADLTPSVPCDRQVIGGDRQTEEVPGPLQGFGGREKLRARRLEMSLLPVQVASFKANARLEDSLRRLAQEVQGLFPTGRRRPRAGF